MQLSKQKYPNIVAFLKPSWKPEQNDPSCRQDMLLLCIVLFDKNLSKYLTIIMTDTQNQEQQGGTEKSTKKFKIK